jgi:hypothetical protein
MLIAAARVAARFQQWEKNVCCAGNNSNGAPVFGSRKISSMKEIGFDLHRCKLFCSRKTKGIILLTQH